MKYYAPFIYLLLIVLSSSCLKNSNVFIQKNKNSSVNNRLYTNLKDSIPQEQLSIQNHKINIADFLDEDNKNSSFFISLVNANTNEYLEARSIEISQDSVLLDVTLKDTKKNNSLNFTVNLDTRNIRTRLINTEDINEGFVLEYSNDSIIQNNSSLFNIRKFEASSIEKNILHLYTGEISYANQEYSKFIIINDIANPEEILATFSVWLSTEIDIEKIKTRCREELKKECKIGTLKIKPFNINDEFLSTIITCHGDCTND